MYNPRPHTLAVEIDRALKLNLNGGRFQALADMISNQEDMKKFAGDLMTKSPKEVLGMIANWRENE